MREYALSADAVGPFANRLLMLTTYPNAASLAAAYTAMRPIATSMIASHRQVSRPPSPLWSVAVNSQWMLNDLSRAINGITPEIGMLQDPNGTFGASVIQCGSPQAVPSMVAIFCVPIPTPPPGAFEVTLRVIYQSQAMENQVALNTALSAIAPAIRFVRSIFQ